MSTSSTGFDVTPLSSDRIAALARDLNPAERQVILHQGTERAFCGLFLDNKKTGVYTCRLCGLPLFKSDAKFESGTGWPSFFQPFDPLFRKNGHGAVVPITIKGPRDEPKFGLQWGQVFK